MISASLSGINGIAFFDTAGKYGAGLALEVLGSCQAELNTESSKVIISNKLGWYRTLFRERDYFRAWYKERP